MIDPSKSGLEIFGFKPYEIAMLRIIWRDGRSCSGEIFKELRGKGLDEARPTYSVALKRYEKKGILVGESQYGAQRTRVWYSPHPDCANEKALIEKRLKHLFRRLREEFPDHYPTREV